MIHNQPVRGVEMKKFLLLALVLVIAWLAWPYLQFDEPRLVVYISIDQMRYDYLDRFNEYFTEGGFNKLRNRGAFFSNSHYGHYCTYTAPGHALLGTSCYAGKSGIIGNNWYDKDSKESIYCVDDLNYKNTEGPDEHNSGAKSPKNLLVTSLGDELQAKDAQAKVFSVSGKNRAAILMAGKHPDAAYWFNIGNGHFITSTYYMEDTPRWVKDFNADTPADKLFNTSWKKLLPEEAYALCSADDFPSEATGAGMGRTFPHPLNAGKDQPTPDYYSNLLRSPFADQLALQFATQLIVEEQLGTDNHTDLLTISLSSTDYIGHTWGPDSHEMLDQMVRLDRALQQFFLFLEKKVGTENLIIALSADHGVAPFPEISKEKGLDAGRIDPASIKNAAETRLINVFGNPPRGESWIASTANANIYLNEKIRMQRNATPRAVQGVLKEAIEGVPGVLRVITRNELQQPLSDEPILHSAQLAFNPERSGEVIIIQKPYWIFNYKDGSTTGTTHGSPHNYDTHVPTMIYGTGVRQATIEQPVGPADIAVTLGNLLGIELPGERDGIVLEVAK